MLTGTGMRIRDLRKLYRLSVDELSDKLGITPGFLGLVEREKRMLGYEKLIKLCNVFNVSLDYLILGKENSKHPNAKKNSKIANCYNEVMKENERNFIDSICKLIIPFNADEKILKVLHNSIKFQINQINILSDETKNN